jgi:hypothetical protein
MNLFAAPDAPPTDFVTFLAQRGGLSPEAAAHRLERWFGEYQAAPRSKTRCRNVGHADPRPTL